MCPIEGDGGLGMEGYMVHSDMSDAMSGRNGKALDPFSNIIHI